MIAQLACTHNVQSLKSLIPSQIVWSLGGGESVNKWANDCTCGFLLDGSLPLRLFKENIIFYPIPWCWVCRLHTVPPHSTDQVSVINGLFMHCEQLFFYLRRKKALTKNNNKSSIKMWQNKSNFQHLTQVLKNMNKNSPKPSKIP